MCNCICRADTGVTAVHTMEVAFVPEKQAVAQLAKYFDIQTNLLIH